MTDFPYQRTFTSDEEIYKMFHNLQKFNYKDIITFQSYSIRNVSMPSYLLTFIGKPLLLVCKNEYYEKWERLSDMFQEKCRMKCNLYGHPSPYDYFTNNFEKIRKFAIEKYGNLSPKSLRESIYHLSNECTAHKPIYIMTLIKLFKAKSVFDFSAGWGDRLIGAMASDVDYCGVDPNPCLHDNYRQMINFFRKSPKKYVMIENTIEDAVIPSDKIFDMVFTSPPYFDLEKYANNGKQSISKYDNEERWFNGFLKIALEKSWKHLKNDGVICININQKNRGEKYIEMMHEEVNSYPNSIYLGVISYANEDLKNPQPIWIWKKTVFKLETERLYIRKFNMNDVKEFSKLTSKKENMEFIASGKVLNYKETNDLISKYIKKAYTMYPIILKDTKTIIGIIGHYDGNYIEPKYTNKIFTRIMIDDNYRRKGYANEIYAKYIKFLNTDIYTMIKTDNIPRIEMATKMGFKLLTNIKFHGKDYYIYYLISIK